MAAMSRRFLLTFVLLFLLHGTRPGKVKIVEEPAVYRSGMNNFYQPAGSPTQNDNKSPIMGSLHDKTHRSISTPVVDFQDLIYVVGVTKPLVARVKPSPVSGPTHLQVLAGKCFSLIHNGYKYEFCPFHNVTQREQTARWNAFAGILGVWREWVILNNTFEAMLLANGDMCPGNIPRQTKAFLRCGDVNKVISVEEPAICHYELRFESPLACPIDAFLVYPVLSTEGQKEWEQIEEALYRQELTIQGYNKYRRRLFQMEKLMPQDTASKEEKEEKKKKVAEEPVSNPKTDKKNTGNNHNFRSKEECSKAYDDLLAEVQRLRRQSNISNDSNGRHTTKLPPAPSNNILQSPTNDTELLTKLSSNKDGLKNLNEHINNSVTSFKGDLGYRRTPHNESSQVGRQEKVLLSEVNNMKGDPGVVMNKKEKSSDNKQTKPLRKKLIKAGEF